MHHEITGYKLAQHPGDLIYTQIFFQYLCAEQQYNAMQKAMGKYGTGESGTGGDYSPLKVTDQDSPEEIKEKFRIMKECLWQ